MSILSWVICDIWGNELAQVGERSEASVDINVGQPRTSTYKVSMYDDSAFFLTRGLDRIIKVYHPAFMEPLHTGILLEPDWDYDEGVVTVATIDGWLRCQKAFLHDYLDLSAGRRICEAMGDFIGRASNRPYPLGAPGLGIFIGTLQPTGLPNEFINDVYEPGTNVAQTIEDLSGRLGSNDFVLVPQNRTDGLHWRFDAPTRQGIDRGGNIQFHFNTGLNNCVGFRFNPTGVDVNTDYMGVGQADSSDPGAADTFSLLPHRRAYSTADQLRFGIYEGWESVDTTSADVCGARAGEMVAAYHEPPPFFEVTPANESDIAKNPELTSPPRFGYDYSVGDTGIRAIARKGAGNEDHTGRVLGVTVTEEANGELRVTLRITPDVGAGVTLAYE